MICFGKPKLNITENRAVLSATVDLDGRQETVWFSTEKEYAEYLTAERSDAFVVAFLTTAMRRGEDIKCEAPMTKRLYYQITTYLIPTMAAAMDIYQSIAIHASVVDAPLPCERAVGTGWTGGVDSMHTLMTHLNATEPSRKLTHLLVANVGTLESDHNTELLGFMANKARKNIAAETKLSVITIDSNIHLLQNENYLAVAAFRLPAAVLAVQKLFGVFLNSGAYEFNRLSFVKENSAYYELLPLTCFETDCTVFYSTGSHISRMQKLKELSDFPLAQKYLHPCIYAERENCGSCGKCIRTIGALYALGALDKFNKVFDTEKFYNNKNFYLLDILSKKNSQHYGEVIAEMKRRGIELPPEVVRQERVRRAAIMSAQRHSERLKNINKQ